MAKDTNGNKTGTVTNTAPNGTKGQSRIVELVVVDGKVVADDTQQGVKQ